MDECLSDEQSVIPISMQLMQLTELVNLFNGRITTKQRVIVKVIN